jgi:hypothetical protein
MNAVADLDANMSCTQFLRRYWRGLLLRQLAVWAVIGALCAVLSPTDFPSAMPVILIGGAFFNVVWAFII